MRPSAMQRPSGHTVTSERSWCGHRTRPPGVPPIEARSKLSWLFSRIDLMSRYRFDSTTVDLNHVFLATISLHQFLYFLSFIGGCRDVPLGKSEPRPCVGSRSLQFKPQHHIDVV